MASERFGAGRGPGEWEARAGAGSPSGRGGSSAELSLARESGRGRVTSLGSGLGVFKIRSLCRGGRAASQIARWVERFFPGPKEG